MKREKTFKTEELQKLRKIVREKTGYPIQGRNLLIQAFTRRSCTAEGGGENGEILEFIGDQVLSYCVTKKIAARYGAFNKHGEYEFRVRENAFAALKQELVNNKALAGIVDGWDLMQYVVAGKSDHINRIDEQEKVKADLFESILGAIAVDCKWDAAVMEQAVTRMLSLDERLEEVIAADGRPESFRLENAVSTLKELVEQGRCRNVEYRYVSPQDLGYDKDGNPIWHCTCSVSEWGAIRGVFSCSKKRAKQWAAYLVLCQHYELQNEYGVNRQCGSWREKDGKVVPDIGVEV